MHKEKLHNKFLDKVYLLNKGLGKIETVLSIIIMWLLIAVCCVFISCRFIFHISTPWADESARYLLILLGWMGAACAASDNGHLQIDILEAVVRKRAKNPDKVLAITDRIAQMLSMLFLGFFIYQYTLFVIKMANTGTPSSTLPFDMWVPMSFIIIGGILVFLHMLFNMLLPKNYGLENDNKAEHSAQMEGE